MNLSVLPTNIPIPKDDGACKHLLNKTLSKISLDNQSGNSLQLNRKDTFRIVLFCFPMTENSEIELKVGKGGLPPESQGGSRN